VGNANPSNEVTPQQKADVAIALARSLEMQGQTDGAIQKYEDAVRMDNKRGDAYHRLAVLHDLKGDCESSYGLYQAAIKNDPDNPELLCDFGYSCYLQSRWKPAEDNLRRAIALKPELGRAHNNLGLLLARTDRPDEALGEFVRAGCSEAQARANLAFALMLEERWKEAQRQFDIALAAEPDLEAAQNGLVALQSLNPTSQLRQPSAGTDRQRRPVTPTAFRNPVLGSTRR
jgi:Tfp pilus assembly protein PilF